MPRRRRSRLIVLVSALGGLVAGVGPARAGTFPVAPGEDFCQVFNQQAGPGDEVLLAPGDHAGPCVLSQGGTPGLPKALRAADPGDPPRIVYEGASSNVLDVTTSHVVIEGIRFGPTQADIDAIKIKAGDQVRIAGNHFFQIGGISVSANTVDTEGIEIVDNFFEDLSATGIYLGCHGGMASCSARGYTIAGNLIDGVDSANVGYGLEVKLDSDGVVRDNVIHDTKGPGIEIYGSTELTRVNVVERNLVIGSRNNATLEIAGGPTIVRSNLVIGGAGGGLYVYDYQDRGLVRAIQVVGNTVIGDAGPAVALSKWGPDLELEFADNAAWQMAGGGPAMPAAIAGVAWAGNVECTDPGLCWVDAAGWDLGPAPGSPLEGGGAAPTLAALGDDFCGQARGAPPFAGGLEGGRGAGPGPLSVAFKSTFACEGGGGTTGGTGGETSGGDTSGGTTGEGTSSAGTSGGATSEGTSGGSASGGSVSAGTTAGATGSTSEGGGEDGGGCACASGGGGGSGWALLVVALLRRRRARGCTASSALWRPAKIG